MKSLFQRSMLAAAKVDHRHVKFAVAVGTLLVLTLAAGAPAPYNCGHCYGG